ncbi:transposase [Rhizobium sp. LjRoot258]|uniref:transposase n=1 Tax=Rhizobium sp. LjRoot258 TaxID=3342299 RepID=UPI003ECFBA8B
MTISELTLETREEEPVRRFEVFTGTVRHRDWSNEEKAQIVAEGYSANVMVFAVARRHWLSPEQLFTRRRLLRNRQHTQPERESIDCPKFRSGIHFLETGEREDDGHIHGSS